MFCLIEFTKGIELPMFLFYRLEDEMVFAFITPPSAKIKERIIYASAKGNVLSSIEGVAGLKIKKRFELDSCEELDRDLVKDEEVVEVVKKLPFARPARPGR
jgi:hypothetical protein